MTHDTQTRIPGTGRRLAAAASIVALSLGTLALAGCGNDDDLPPMEQDAPMEEPMDSQDPVQEPMEEEPMGSDEPMEEEPMGSDEPMSDDEEEEDS